MDKANAIVVGAELFEVDTQDVIFYKKKSILISPENPIKELVSQSSGRRSILSKVIRRKRFTHRAVLVDFLTSLRDKPLIGLLVITFVIAVKTYFSMLCC